MSLQESSQLLMIVSVLYSFFVYLNYRIYKRFAIYMLSFLLLLRTVSYVAYAMYTNQPAFLAIIFAEIIFGSMSMKEVAKNVTSK
jgi:hypothetical protein